MSSARPPGAGEPAAPAQPALEPAPSHPAAAGVAAAAVVAPEDQPRRVGRNVGVLAASQLITWMMTLLWTLVVPRALGPGGMGTMMSAWAVTAILGLALGLGTRTYLVRESVVDLDRAPRLIGTTIILRVALAPLLFGGAVAYGEIVGWEGDARIVLYLAAAATIFVQVGEPMQAGFQATERMEYMAYSEIINKSAQGLVGIIVVLVGFGTIGVTAAWATMAAVVVVLNSYWLRRLLRIELRTSIPRMIAVARDSVAYWAYGVFFMLYLWLDFVLLSLLTREEVVGWYAVPMKLFQTMMFLPVIISVAWLPRFVRGFEEGRDQLRGEARTPVALVVLLSLPIAAATIVAADPAIGLLYGAEYEGSVPVMMILGLCLPPMYLNIMLSQVLVAMKRQTTWTWAMVAATAVNPLFNFALIPATESRYGNGAIGAAASLFLTELVVVGAGLVLVGRFVFDRATVRRLVLALAAAAAACGAGLAARAFGPAASFAAAAATFVALAVILRLFTTEEIQLMKSGLARARGRVPFLSRAAAAPAAPDERRRA